MNSLNIIINASNLTHGGGIQVGDSICCYLNKYPWHHFIVVLSAQMKDTEHKITDYANVTVLHYNVRNTFSNLVLGRDKYLDSIVDRYHIDIVFTVFGVSKWVPKVPHLSGFARPQLLQRHSPYFARMNWLERTKSNIKIAALRYLFDKSSDYFWTENPQISLQLQKLFPGKKVFTITNYYHQVYDQPRQWDNIKLPDFDGYTLLTISASYPHKNLGIYKEIAHLLEKKSEKFRIVLTINEDDFPPLDKDLRNHFLFLGHVDIEQCPSLYEQADILLQPSLLECFSASYPEAMKMDVPIVTTDMDFAHGLCHDAALYYSPLSAEDATNKILSIVHDPELRNHLILKGRERLKEFDNNEQRADKIIQLLEQIYKESQK